MQNLTRRAAAIPYACAALVLATSVHAGSPACSVESLAALHVPEVTIASAIMTPATGTNPEFCAVEGTVVTKGEGAPNGAAGFMMQLPTSWQHRFFFMGVGGNAGNFRPSVNPVDRAVALKKGYATIVTDTGHHGDGTTVAWVTDAGGHRDAAKIADFFYRAAHDVTLTGKKLAEAYYAGRIDHAYFDGCSTGGRMAMMEAERYPTDFDGIIAGDPAMDYRVQINRIAMQKAQLASPAAYIPATLLPMIDRAVLAKCDAIDGVKDGLIQNPGRCDFKPESLQCQNGSVADCLTEAQVATLRTYLAPLRDATGHMLYPGMTVSDMSGPYSVQQSTIGIAPPDFSNPTTPWDADPAKSPAGWNMARETMTYWLGLGPTARMDDFDVNPQTGVVGAAALKQVDSTFAEAMPRDPAKLLPFAQQGRKMIMYHGYSDPRITPFRTSLFYEEFAKLRGNYVKAQDNVRLFMVPGMYHCSGGPGPSQFDTLTALENWVEHGVPPDGIIATAAPDATRRSMPLCMFPEQAEYRGTGDVNDAANWSCTSNRRLLQ
jgi:feruloyl esterase